MISTFAGVLFCGSKTCSCTSVQCLSVLKVRDSPLAPQQHSEADDGGTAKSGQSPRAEWVGRGVPRGGGSSGGGARSPQGWFRYLISKGNLIGKA